MRTILLTGAGGAPALNFIESLKLSGEQFRTIGVDCDKYHLVLAPTDERFLVPPASHDDYLPVLRSILRDENVDLLFVQPDPEVAVISEARDSLDAIVCLPSRESVRICQNKFLTYELWEQAGIKQPYTRLIQDESDLVALYDKVPSIWLRPLRGAAGRGSFFAKSIQEAVTWLELNKGWNNYTGAQYLSPHSVTWQSLWNDGELIVAQGRKRLYWEFGDRTLSGVTGITGGAMTVSDTIVDDVALKAIYAVDSHPHGIFSVDLTYDEEGHPNPTEINIGRFFTTQLFFSQVGLNMPYMVVKLALGDELPAVSTVLNPLPPGLLWLRGMDRRPILTTTQVLDGFERTLQERRLSNARS